MVRNAVIAACVLLAAATALRLKRGGGPYFQRPVTIVDHVGPRDHEVRSAIVKLRSVSLPAGATVAVVPDDTPHYLTAVALLPKQRVVHGPAQYVLDLR